MNPNILFTTSWDDGHPLDLRMAEVLDKHGFKGTFFVPLRNCSGDPVLEPRQIRELATRHELASHTRNHVYLDGVSSAIAKKEIEAGKAMLEEIIGYPVDGFAYPGGHYRRDTVDLVRGARFRYARTTENFRLDAGSDLFRLPTTMQFYPHSRSIYLRNFLKLGHYGRRAKIFVSAMIRPEPLACLEGLLAPTHGRGIVIHVWGHSREIESLGMWNSLDRFLKCVAEIVPVCNRITNRDLIARMETHP